MQMMFGEGDSVEADILGQTRQFNHFIDHALPPFRMAGDRTQRSPFLECCRQRRKKKVHKFHNFEVSLLTKRGLSIAC